MRRRLRVTELPITQLFSRILQHRIHWNSYTPCLNCVLLFNFYPNKRRTLKHGKQQNSSILWSSAFSALSLKNTWKVFEKIPKNSKHITVHFLASRKTIECIKNRSHRCQTQKKTPHRPPTKTRLRQFHNKWVIVRDAARNAQCYLNSLFRRDARVASEWIRASAYANTHTCYDNAIIMEYY